MPAPAQIKVLRISASAEGYRHDRLTFGRTDVDIPASILTSHQIHHLKRDPMLTCHEVLISTEPAVSEEEMTRLREKAAIADAFLARLPDDFSWSQCPSEYITHLQDHIHDLELAKTPAHASTTKTHGRK